MNLIYFTSGSGLFDGDVRRQCLRIAEVLSAVQGAQAAHKDWDLMSSLMLDEEFDKLDETRRRELTRLVQWGLFEKFCRHRIPYADMFYRVNYASPTLVAKEFRWLLRTGDPLTIYVVGPGLDEVPLILKDHRAEFIETIDFDDSLQWFWSGLKKVANA